MSHQRRPTNQDTPQYYMPYDSGEDTDATSAKGTDEDYDSEDLPDWEDPRIRREEDPRYAIIRTAGPSFNTSAQQLKYMEHAPGAEYDVTTNISSLSSLVYLDPPKTTLTSLFSIKSSNRDTTVWTSPFNFQIKTPRVYKNVTKFQLVQLSFPNNAAALTNTDLITSTVIIYLENLGFNLSTILCCLDLVPTMDSFTTIGVAEQGRVNTNGDQIYTTLTVPSGIYSNDALAKELTAQSNNTPPLNIISYNDFANHFTTTGDPSVLFNEPGSLFFSRFTSERHGFHTKETIMNNYFTQQHLNTFPIVTDLVAFNAYYYPILKELAATRLGIYFINLAGSGLSSREEAVNYILHFKGLDNTTYYTIGSTNQVILDEYRKNLTFEHKNINAHQWSFDSLLGRFKVEYSGLHTSLKNDINGRYNTYFDQELTLAGFTARSFQTLKTNLANTSAVFGGLKSYFSTLMSMAYPGEGNYQYFGGNYHSTQLLGVWHSYSVGDLSAVAGITSSLSSFASTFGRQFGTFAGTNMAFSTFFDYHSTMSSYYINIQSTSAFISNLHGSIHDRHHHYVSSKYSGIFPQNVLDTRSYNSGVGVPTAIIGNKMLYTPGDAVADAGNYCTSSFYSTTTAACKALLREKIISYFGCLPVTSIIPLLSYRLGIFNLSNLSFSSITNYFGTVSTQNFNLFMQINNDQSFNNMDVAMNENLSISNETTGQVKLMSAKILTGGLGAGEESQTCIQNPILFTNTLGKLDKLEFKIYADDNNLTPLWLYFPFEIGANEWDATFQIDEEISFADRNTGWGTRPTVPLPSNPAAMPFLALTSTNNPNNK